MKSVLLYLLSHAFSVGKVDKKLSIMQHIVKKNSKAGPKSVLGYFAANICSKKCIFRYIVAEKRQLVTNIHVCERMSAKQWQTIYGLCGRSVT